MPRIYVLRRDGVVQRYYVKSFKPYVKIGRIDKRVLWAKPETVKVVVERYEKVVREIPPETVVYKPTTIVREAKLWRYSYGIKWVERGEDLLHVIPVHRRYYGALIQAFSFDRSYLESFEDRLKEELIRLVEDFLEYPRDEWWFVIDDGEGYQIVDYDRDLEDRWIARIEDEYGMTILQDEGDLDEL